MLPETSNTIANMGIVCAFMMVLFIHLPYTKDASAAPLKGKWLYVILPKGLWDECINICRSTSAMFFMEDS